MLEALLYSLIFVLIVSLISLIGVFTIFFRSKTLHKVLSMSVAFAAGSMFAAAFLDLMPEAVANSKASPFPYVIVGIIVFLVMEKFLHWYHCHKGEPCKIHPYTTLNLVGDGVHNFVDGVIIMAAFMASTSLGIITSLSVIFHEIPQEIGDFSVLLKGGYTKKKALVWNFLIALTAFIGVFAAYFFLNFVQANTFYLIAFAAGGFIYIAGTDILPEMHKETDMKKSIYQILFFILGIVVIWLSGKVF